MVQCVRVGRLNGSEGPRWGALIHGAPEPVDQTAAARSLSGELALTYGGVQ